jgi:hypothetical protein
MKRPENHAVAAPKAPGRRGCRGARGPRGTCGREEERRIAQDPAVRAAELDTKSTAQ